MHARALFVATLVTIGSAWTGARPLAAQDRPPRGDRVVDLRGGRPNDAPEVHLWLERSNAYDAVRVYVRPASNAYVAVVRIDQAGRAALLFPRAPGDDAQLEAGVTYRVRDVHETSAAHSTSSTRAYVFAIASDDPFDFREFERDGVWSNALVGDAAAALDPVRGVRLFASRVLDERSRFAFDFEELGAAAPAVIADVGCAESCQASRGYSNGFAAGYANGYANGYTSDIIYGGASAYYLRRVAFSCFGSSFGWSFGYARFPFAESCVTYRRLRPLHIAVLPGVGRQSLYVPRVRLPRAPYEVTRRPDIRRDARDDVEKRLRTHSDRARTGDEHAPSRIATLDGTRGGWIEGRSREREHDQPTVIRGGDYTARGRSNRDGDVVATEPRLPQVFRGSPRTAPREAVREPSRERARSGDRATTTYGGQWSGDVRSGAGARAAPRAESPRTMLPVTAGRRR